MDVMDVMDVVDVMDVMDFMDARDGRGGGNLIAGGAPGSGGEFRVPGSGVWLVAYLIIGSLI